MRKQQRQQREGLRSRGHVEDETDPETVDHQTAERR
jgi:hypothetical protein